jgi:hypothetical protein
MESVILVLAIIVVVVAVFLVHYRPNEQPPMTAEGFSMAASVDPALMPACVSRSTDAQSLLAQLEALNSDGTDDTVAELRLLLTKLCCMEADIATPSPGTYRTYGLQFRTQQDIEPPATLVGRCLANAVNSRDIEIIIDKYTARGHVLLDRLKMPSSATTEFDAVVTRLRVAMTSFCFIPQPSMDHPTGARDMGFWEPANVAELSTYDSKVTQK